MKNENESSNYNGHILLSTKTEAALYQFIKSDNFSELISILTEHSDLLSDLVDDKMRRILADQIYEASKRRVAERLLLLIRCRKLGIENVFQGQFHSEVIEDNMSTKIENQK